MKILAIDTSCDETSAAITEGKVILANIVWSQASQHAKFGGVMPSLAQRMHEERIDWVAERALKKAGLKIGEIEAIAVTSGPGLAIALGVGIKKAQQLARVSNLPLVEINHVEGHLLSPLAGNISVEFPVLGLVVSGGHTELIYAEKIGTYQITAATQDDALGEALDKAARMLGLGYPGGAFLEKLAREGNNKTYPLPLPMAGREDRNSFSYSGIKTAFFRLIESVKKEREINKQTTADLAASFQDMAFKHLTRVLNKTINNSPTLINSKTLLVGGGVAANLELRKRLRKLGKELGMKVYFPASKRLCGDNAGMIGIAAGFKMERGEFLKGNEVDKADRKPRWQLNTRESIID